MMQASGSLPKDDQLFAPGLVRRRRGDGTEARYWVAPARDVKAGFTPKTVPLPRDLTDLEIAAECRKHWLVLESWRAFRSKPATTQHSFGWLIDRYETDENSPYQRLGHASKKNYRQINRVIRAQIGNVLLNRKGYRELVADDVWRWHKAWSDRGPSVARHAITQLRILVNYARSIGVPTASAFHNDVLATIQFPTTGARQSAPSLEQVMAIIDQALKQGLRSIAITTLAQFEFIERRISIMGQWEGDHWRSGWVWSGLSGRTRVGISKDWVITYTQNKVGEVVRQYDLKATPLLLQLLQETPEDRRIGAVIVCETTGQPWRTKHYTDTFREIARAAKIPDEVWSMDMRAGGATEADGIFGITDRDLKNAGGWKSDVFNRYTRAPHRRAQNVLDLRQKARKT